MYFGDSGKLGCFANQNANIFIDKAPWAFKVAQLGNRPKKTPVIKKFFLALSISSHFGEKYCPTYTKFALVVEAPRVLSAPHIRVIQLKLKPNQHSGCHDAMSSTRRRKILELQIV